MLKVWYVSALFHSAFRNAFAKMRSSQAWYESKPKRSGGYQKRSAIIESVVECGVDCGFGNMKRVLDIEENTI